MLSKAYTLIPGKKMVSMQNHILHTYASSYDLHECSARADPQVALHCIQKASQARCRLVLPSQNEKRPSFQCTLYQYDDEMRRNLAYRTRSVRYAQTYDLQLCR